MATASLIKVNPSIWKQSFFPTQQWRRRINSAACCSINKAATFNGGFSARTAAKFSIKCFTMNRQKQSSSSTDESKETSANPLDVVTDAFLHVLKTLRKPAIAAVLLLGALLMYHPYYHSAMAASGGRMGGSSFSSSSSSSSTKSPETSISYSTPSSYSSSKSYYTRSPESSVKVYSVSTTSPVSSVKVYSVTTTSPESSVSYSGLHKTDLFIMMGFFLFLAFCIVYELSVTAKKTSVLKLQVGLLGLARSLQSDLNSIAEVADTSTPQGLSYVLTETTLALLRHRDYCISYFSFAVEVLWSPQNEKDTLSKQGLLEDYPLLRPLE